MSCCRSGWRVATPLASRLLLLALLLGALGVITVVVLGAEHSMRLTDLIARLADTSAQTGCG